MTMPQQIPESPTPEEVEAQTLLSSLFRRHIAVSSSIAGSRHASKLLLKHGASALKEDATSAAKRVLRLPFVTPEMRDALGGETGIIVNALNHQERSLQATIDSSALVFMHSALDDAVLQCCRATMLCDPDAWEPRVAEKKLALKDLKQRDYREVRRRLLDDYCKELDRRSLPHKVEMILGVLKPEKGEWDIAIEDLREVDDLRNEIVHELGPQQIPQCSKHLGLMERAVFTILFKVWITYPQSMDPELWKRPAVPDQG